MEDLPSIGRCLGCTRRDRLRRGFCRECCVVPTWDEVAYRVRSDIEYAFASYRMQGTDEERAWFVETFAPSPFATALRREGQHAALRGVLRLVP